MLFAEAERNSAVSSVRDLTPSFWKMCRTWVCTVFSVTNIAVATSRLVWPCAIRRGDAVLGVGEPARRIRGAILDSSCLVLSAHSGAPRPSKMPRARPNDSRAADLCWPAARSCP